VRTRLLRVGMAIVHSPSKTICLLMTHRNDGIDANGSVCRDLTPD
jgi:hypothetical protein